MTMNIRDAVHAQIEEKITAGETLHTAIENAEQARTVLSASEAAIVDARRAALKAGWSENELKSLGLATTPRKPRTRPTNKPRS